MGVCRQIEPPGRDRGLELREPIPPIAELLDDAVEIRHEVETGRRVRAEGLIEREMARLAAQLAVL